MYDIKWIRENLPVFEGGLSRRGMPAPELKALIVRILKLDEDRRAAITAFEQGQARRNAASKEIGEAKKVKDEVRANALMAEVGELKTRLPELEAAAKKLDDELNGPGGLLATMPNTPLDEVPTGADEHGNVEHHRSGARRNYAFKPKQHFELGEALGQMDFELAAKLSGARFVVLQRGLARMERALGQLFLDTHTQEHGYTEVSPPLLVRDEVMYGTAQLPKFEDDQFFAGDSASLLQMAGEIADMLDKRGADEKELSAIEKLAFQWTRRWLIPTAEVPLTNLVRESIVAEDELPLRLTACTPCFRAEAGAAGKDTRGMIRQHQFTKVELVSITTPDKSLEEHERMLACAEAVLKKLDLHYRVVTLCTGDMGFASQKTYDIEVWLPGQNMYREISSCSVCGDFQARRMNARYRPNSTSEAGLARAGSARAGSGPRFVHTLNGSGVAVGRALIAVMENYQDENGAIAVPEALKPYMGGMAKIEKM